MPATPFRVAIVPGVNPGKWTKAWAERQRVPLEVTPIDAADQRTVLVDGQVDLAFVRLPIDRDGLSVIRLYEEAPVVVVPKEHPVSLFDDVTLADLDGETFRTEPIDDAIDLVVAGVGILLLPQSIARQHARRDLAVRPVTDAPVTEIAIAWLSDHTTEDIDEFVGIVRGRTAGSSRGATPSDGAPKKAAPKKAVTKNAASKKPGQQKKKTKPSAKTTRRR